LEGEGGGPEIFGENSREGPYNPDQLSAQGKFVKTGGCLCGGVRYRVTGPLRAVVYCHCSQCRRTSGHFVAATAVAKDALTVVADESIEWFASSEFASRGFCSRCGSSLFWLAEARDYVCIMAGTLDESTGLEAVEHIYVKDKGDYYDLTDDLPKASGHP